LSCNLAEILIIFFAMLLGWPIPLLPIHLLWLNLVTDSFPAFGLGMENKEPDVMQVAPRDPAEALLNHNMQIMLGVQSVVMTIAVLVVFRSVMDSAGVEAARTAAFAALSCSELFQAFVVRSERHFVLRIGLFANRYLNAGIAMSFALLLASVYTPLSAVLKTVELSPDQWQLIVAVAVLPFITGELGKRVIDISGKRIMARKER
jgi:Ca2+-transporting ATPase